MNLIKNWNNFLHLGEKIKLVTLLMIISNIGFAQPLYDYSQPFIATSQLGFREHSPKEISFYAGNKIKELPEQISFYITYVGYRLPRKKNHPKEWDKKNNVFRWPFNTTLMPYVGQINEGAYLYKGVMKKVKTRWGIFWRGDFSDFIKPGIYQIECEYGFSSPFQIDDKIYERLQRGYLEYMYCQRSGVEIPGIRPVENADDARLYSDTSIYLPVAGGWNDAGDWRKWLFLTLPNLDALGQIAQYSHPAFKEQAIEEMKWGNAYFQNMITDEGRVYEDVGAGQNRAGNYEDSWWNENHPGVTAAGDNISDNIPLNGIERHVRIKYNPLVQYQFIRHQAKASTIMSAPYKNNCLVLADKAWRYAESVKDDQRTLFVAQQLLAAVELYLAGSPNIAPARIKEIAMILLERQETSPIGLSGYFMEKDNKDGYRSIAFNDEPAMAILRLLEADIKGIAEVNDMAEKCLTAYIENYLLADAQSNPFSIPPYGIYVNPPFEKEQVFRKANDNRKVRTFIRVFSEDPLPHGVNQVFLEHAYLMARAGKLLKRKEYQVAAEKILNWTMGHNPFGLCLFTGVGFKHPIPASFMNYKIPSAAVSGFLGTPDDQPYIETQNLVEWSTQEIWDVPYFYTIGIISYLE
ncbi:MAG: glycoside hydrolase family 9 protein [Bacteroidales bacterium]|nr:glycoside hydrolase family 9 protein [Bacteroidales bacterium]